MEPRGSGLSLTSFGLQSLGHRDELIRSEGSKTTAFGAMAATRFQGIDDDDDAGPSKSGKSTLSLSKAGSQSTRFKDLPAADPSPRAPGGATITQLPRHATGAAAAAAPEASSPSPPTSARGANPNAPPKWGTRRAAEKGKGAAMPTARALYMKVQGLSRVPQAALTQQLWSRSVWDVLRGGAKQQRVWTLGNSLMGGAAGDPDDGIGVHTSQRPFPVVEGVMMTSVAAGGHTHKRCII